MTRSVDLVVVGGTAAAIAATIDAVGRGLRVLVVIRRQHPGLAQHLRQAVGAVRTPAPGQLTILAGTEVVCVDGVPDVEAVVVRRLRTRRLIGVNAAAVLEFGNRDVPRREARPESVLSSGRNDRGS
ncbi:MAG: hypothetical protein AB7P34_15655 [Vicinamibacterales bacterium]